MNDQSSLFARIDYILFKNGWMPVKADNVGEKQQDRTDTGLWPSDHAGVTATLKLGCRSYGLAVMSRQISIDDPSPFHFFVNVGLSNIYATYLYLKPPWNVKNITI